MRGPSAFGAAGRTLRRSTLAGIALAASQCGGGGSPDPLCPPDDLPTLPDGECRSNDDCPTDQVCGAAFPGPDEGEAALVTGVCRPIPADGGEAGAACAVPDDCQSGLCALIGRCVPACAPAGGDDCAPGDRCLDGVVRHPDPAVGSSRASFCAPRVALAPGAVDRSEHLLRAAGLRPDDQGAARIPLPSLGPRGLAVVEVGCPGVPPPRPSRLLVDRGTPPAVLFDRSTVIVGAPKALNSVERARPVVVYVPNGALDVAPDARLTLEVDRAEATDLSLQVLRGLNGAGGGGVLDLDLFYVGEVGLIPAGDRGPPALAAALDRAEGLLAAAGISFGVVRQHLVPGDLGARLAVVELPSDLSSGGPDELGELLRLGAGKTEASLSVFLVRGTVPPVLGLAGGIPIPFGMPATAGSGLLIAWDELAGDPNLDPGQVIAHEIGHALGLWHPTELFGTVLDPLPDTPICLPPEGAFAVSRDTCPGELGADNLMFFQAAPPNAPNQLTSDQAELLGRAPILRR